jgi:hypothetical protein
MTAFIDDGEPGSWSRQLRYGSLPSQQIEQPGGSHLGQPGGARSPALPGEQNTGPCGHQTADTVRGCEGDAASVQKACGGTGVRRAPGSIASTD